MRITFTCPVCGKIYPNVKSKLLGQKAKCSCGSVIRIDNSSEPTVVGSVKAVPSNAAPASDVPTRGKPSSDAPLVDDHYSDLDQILARPTSHLSPTPPVRVSAQQEIVAAPSAFGWRTQASEEAQAAAIAARNRKPTKARLAISFLAVVLSAACAFWFAMLVVVSRFAPVEHVLLQPFTESLAGMNAGRFGLTEISPGLHWGFVMTGWVMWVTAAVMMVLAVGQFLSAMVQLFVQRQWLGWVDGWMATVAVLFVFLIVAGLFLHATHTTNLKRELRKFDSPGAIVVGEVSLENIQRLREQYSHEGQRFMTAMLVAGVMPLSVFGFSMVRMLLSHR